MAEILKKLTTLVRSNLAELSNLDIRALTAPGGSDQVQRNLKALDERIEDARAFRASLTERAEALSQEADRIAQAIASARAEGQLEHARYLTEQYQRAAQRLAMTESEMQEHDRHFAALSAQMIQLELALERARIRHEEAQSQPVVPPSAGAIEALSERLRLTREKVESSVRETASLERPNAPAVSGNAGSSDDDLEARIQRLSRK